MPATQTKHIPLRGGLNQVTPPLTVPDGSLLDVNNFMPALDDGYTRIYGYSRYDGRVAPWTRAAVGVYLTESKYFAIGDRLTCDNGATGTVVLRHSDEHLVILCSTSGTFHDAKTISNGTDTVDINNTSDPYGSTLDSEKEAIENWYRDKIQPPAGVGAVLGLAYGLDTLFAFRRNNDKIACYKATSDGWQALAPRHVMRFKQGGENLPAEGASLTTAGGARCSVIRAVRYGGSKDDLTASGYCMVDNLVGSFQPGEDIIAGQYDAGSLESVAYQLLTLKHSNSDMLLPDVGAKLTADNGATGIVAETVASKIITTQESQLFIVLKSVSGSFAKGQTVKHTPSEEKTFTLGTAEKSAEAAYRLLPLKADQVPYAGDQCVFPSGKALVQQRLTIKKDDDSHEYLLLKNKSGTVRLGNTVSVNILAGKVAETPWLFELPYHSKCRFEFVTHNFYGGTDSKRIYGCSSVSPAFELDGDCLFPILMAEKNDTNEPTHITAHKEHLFLGFPGGIVRHSLVGEPLNFNGQLGAVEFGAGDDVTALHTTSGGVLLVACRNKLQVLYGNSSANWELKLLSSTSGALPGTVQTLGQTVALDDTGIVELSRIEAFGDFEFGTVSRLIQPLVNELKNLSVGTAVIRDFNQIRFYFNNGVALAFKPNFNGSPAITRLTYPIEPTCVCHGEDRDGNAVVFFGSKSGMVYQDSVGTNFDGKSIPAYFQTSYSHLGSPALRKTFKRVELDFSGEYGTKVYLSAEIDYSELHVPTIRANSIPITGGGGWWDMSNWNEFYWSANAVNSGGTPITGTGRNLSLLVTGEHTWASPYTIYGIFVHYIPRRLHRG